jgi:hypothetical protein
VRVQGSLAVRVLLSQHEAKMKVRPLGNNVVTTLTYLSTRTHTPPPTLPPHTHLVSNKTKFLLSVGQRVNNLPSSTFRLLPGQCLVSRVLSLQPWSARQDRGDQGRSRHGAGRDSLVFNVKTYYLSVF